MDFGAATHPGFVRTGNEDGYFASAECAVFAVADGMGGHAHGEVASHLALGVIEAQAEALSHASPTDLPVLLHDTIQEANTAILTQAESQDARSRMGTTLVLATICGNRLYFAHIGDSRLYLLRGDLFTQLTRDHSLVQSMVDRGEITSEEAAIHPLRHQITRVVGGDNHVSPEIASQALEPGDVILLCTDGLSGAVNPEAMKTLLTAPGTAQQTAEVLVQAALDAGGPDNVTALVVHYHTPRVTEAPDTVRHPHHSHFWHILLPVVIALAAFAGGMAWWGQTHPVYYISLDAQSRLVLYERWPLLPMRAPEQIPVPDAVSLTLNDAAPDLDKYPNIREGFIVKDRDTGLYLLQHELPDAVTSRLLEETKLAIDAHNLDVARQTLTRAAALGADPVMVRQLDAQLIKATRPVPPPVPPQR